MTPYTDPEKQLEAHRRWRRGNKERARELWRCANRRRAPRVKHAAHRLISDMDKAPSRCLWHFWHLDGGCRKTARWCDGEWRACDLHRLPTDKPIKP